MTPDPATPFLTHLGEGLENYQDMMRLLTQEKGAIKVYVNVVKEWPQKA
jgi:hypothetical protein